MTTRRRATPSCSTGGIREVRVGVIGAPLHELLVSCQHSVDHLIEYVIGRLAEERRVRMQRPGVLSIEPGDMAKDLLSAGPWFDERHSTLLHAETGSRTPPESDASCATIGGWNVGRESLVQSTRRQRAECADDLDSAAGT